MGPTVRLDVCPEPTAGMAVGLACVVIFPSPQGRSYSEVVLVPIRLLNTLPDLWNLFGWACAKDILGENAEPQENVQEGWTRLSRFVQFCCGRRHGTEVCLEGVFLQENMGMEHSVSMLGSKYWHCSALVP